MGWIVRGMWIGAGFGLAVAVTDLGFKGIHTMQWRFTLAPVFLMQGAALEMGLGALLGMLGSPLLRLRVGRIPAATWHVLWLAVVWLALGLWVALEAPIGRMFAVAPALGGSVLTAVGLGLARRRRWLPWALGALLLVIALATPDVYVAATSLPTAPQVEGAPPPSGAPDVVVVVLDTVRAQSLSTYGYHRPTAPTLEALVAEGTLFADATSPSTWSLPSHASLFTGRFPTGHGAHGEHVTLDDRFPTLAQVLAARGWETSCFTANAWISDGFGLTRGFQWQDRSWRVKAPATRNFSFLHRLLDRLGLVGGDKGGGAAADDFEAWLRERPDDARPYFAFLNFLEAHFPYHQLPRDYATRWTDRPLAELKELSMALMAQQFGGPGRDPAQAGPPATDLYDGGVLYTDHLLGRVVEAVRARGSLDRTVLVVLADHGEMLGERGGFFGHGPSLYQEVVSVPLLIRYPPRIPAGVRVEEPISTVGIFATVLDLVDVEPPPTLHVASLVPVATGTAHPPQPVIAEIAKAAAMGGANAVIRPDPQMRGDTRYRAYRDGSWKLVESSRGESFLYDLASDPGETRDLSEARPDELARLKSQLEEARVRLEIPPLDGELEAGSGALPELDEATQARLRELGYIE